MSSSEDDVQLDHMRQNQPGLDETDDDAALSSSDLPTSLDRKLLPVTLAFKNLFFSVKVRKGKNPFQKKHKKTLLKDLHGELRPGEVTAIMGPSGTVPPPPSRSCYLQWSCDQHNGDHVGSAGAGKTTLLNLLAGRVQNGKIKGSLTVNDIPRNEIGSRRWQRLCSYVMQVRSRL
jgi:ABC-type multidrug transport system fused ATPase/permease subunit